MGIAENKSDRGIGSIEMKELYNSLNVNVNEMQQTNKRSGQKYTLKIIGFTLIKSKFIIIIDGSSMVVLFRAFSIYFQILSHIGFCTIILYN